MLKKYSIYFSLADKFFNKLFFIFITLFSLKISDYFYSYLILFFVLANYFYEIISLSIPKIFNTFYKISGPKKLSILAGTNLYISLSIFFIFFLLFIICKNFLISNFNISTINFYFAFIILGFSIFLNELINQYAFLKLNHVKIYIYDIFTMIVIFLISILTIFSFDFTIKQKIFMIILYYSILQLSFRVVKLILFRSDITFNVKKIYKENNFNKLFDITKYILPIFVISLLVLSQLNISRFVILYFENPSSFAIFVFHIQIIELCSMFFMATHQLSDPKISLFTRNYQLTSFKILRNKLFNIFFTIVPLLLLFIYFIIYEITQIIGINIKINLILFIILSINFILIYFFFTIYQYIIMINQRAFLIKATILSLILNIIFSFIFTNFFSITGLAFANLISNFFLFLKCNNFTNFFFIRKKNIKDLFFLIFRFSLMITFILIYDYLFVFENILVNLSVKILYFLILFIISEFIISKKLKILYVLNNFTQLINLSSKK